MEHERIARDPAVMRGKPIIRNTRVTVEQIIRECAHGLSPKEIAENYPRLQPEDVLAALAFAADCLAKQASIAAE